MIDDKELEAFMRGGTDGDKAEITEIIGLKIRDLVKGEPGDLVASAMIYELARYVAALSLTMDDAAGALGSIVRIMLIQINMFGIGEGNRHP